MRYSGVVQAVRWCSADRQQYCVGCAAMQCRLGGGVLQAVWMCSAGCVAVYYRLCVCVV